MTQPYNMIDPQVRILRTTPVLCGTIQAFYLYGEHEGDVYATGGDIELLQVSLFDLGIYRWARTVWA